MTEYKQLCAELVKLGSSPARSVSELAERMSQVMDLADRARAALAESEPEGPTVMEIIELADEIEAAEMGQVDLVRAALARWGK